MEGQRRRDPIGKKFSSILFYVPMACQVPTRRSLSPRRFPLRFQLSIAIISTLFLYVFTVDLPSTVYIFQFHEDERRSGHIGTVELTRRGNTPRATSLSLYRTTSFTLGPPLPYSLGPQLLCMQCGTLLLLSPPALHRKCC